MKGFHYSPPFVPCSGFPVFEYLFKLTIEQFPLSLCCPFHAHFPQLRCQASRLQDVEQFVIGFFWPRSSFNEPAKKGELLTHLLSFLHSDSSVFQASLQVDHRNNVLVPMSSFKLAPHGSVAKYLKFQDTRQLYIGFSGPGHCLMTWPRKVSPRLVFLSSFSSHFSFCRLWQVLSVSNNLWTIYF